MWRKTTEDKLSSDAAPPQASAPEVAKLSVSSQRPSPVSIPAAPAAPPVPSSGSRITSGLKIHGEISGNSDLYIEGGVQGKIRLGGARVIVGTSGKVEASIDAGAISIDGSVQGGLKASEGVHIGKTGWVQGTIVTPRIGIDDGGRIRGKVETTRDSATVGTRSAESEALHPVTASAKDSD